MPNYHCLIQDELISRSARDAIAKGITDIHCAATGAPRFFVHVLFWPIEAENCYSGGTNAQVAIIRAQVRQGRTPELKRRLLEEISELWVKETGMSKNNLLVTFDEIPGENAMEFGMILPEVRDEAEWLAQHGLDANSTSVSVIRQ